MTANPIDWGPTARKAEPHPFEPDGMTRWCNREGCEYDATAYVHASEEERRAFDAEQAERKRTEWLAGLSAGDAVLIADQERDAEPLEGTIAERAGIYLVVSHAHGKRDPFYASSGWRAWDGALRWRLKPAAEEG